MKKNTINMKVSGKLSEGEDEILAFTNPTIYPPSEDIYMKSKEEQEVDPEDITQRKYWQKKYLRTKNNELSFEDDETGEDLDVPGAELDDDDEKLGSEDEENNYYSLGGDEHDDLDEEKG